MKKIISIIVMMFVFALVPLATSTVTCSVSSIDRSYVEGENPPLILPFSCTNDDTNNSAQINKIGSFFNLSEVTPITISPSGTKGSITLAFNSVPVGFYEGIIYSEGLSIPVKLTVNEAPSQSGCRLIELPHTTTFRLKQGESGASGEIKVKASTECPELDFNVVEQTQMAKPMFVQSKGESSPGKEYSFIIGLDSAGVQTGTYNNQYIVSGSSGNEVYQKSIPLSLIVSQGISAVDNNTFSTFPTCSVDSEMQVNQSGYKLSCSNPNPNLRIEVPYNEFIEIVSINDHDEIRDYNLKPRKIGNTNLMVLFKYDGNVVGTPFSKEIRITKGTIQSGVDMEISFYQFDVKKELSEIIPGDVSVLIKDSTSKDIIPSYTAYLNGKTINNTFNLKANKPYELIIDSPGYNSKTINFTLNPKYIGVTLIPSSDFVEGNLITFNTSVDNVTVFLDGTKLYSDSFTASPGIHTLEFISEGYINTLINITVDDVVKILSISEEWKKGNQEVILLSKVSSWSISYRKDESAQFNPVSNGFGENITYTPEKSGFYQISANGKILGTKEIKGFNWSAKWWFMAWYFWIISAVGIIIVFILLFRGKNHTYSGVSSGGFNMQGVGGEE